MLKWEITGPEGLEKVWQAYVADFPETERKNRERLTTLLEETGYTLRVAMEGQSCVAYAMMLPLKTPGFWWVDYFAVAKAHRGQGVGAEAMRLLMSQCRGVFLEVEHADSAVREEQQIQLARQRFYQRLGAYSTGIPYALPVPSGSYPMDLYVWTTPDTGIISDRTVAQSVAEAFSVIHQEYGHWQQVLNQIFTREDVSCP